MLNVEIANLFGTYKGFAIPAPFSIYTPLLRSSSSKAPRMSFHASSNSTNSSSNSIPAHLSTYQMWGENIQPPNETKEMLNRGRARFAMDYERSQVP